MLLSEVGETPYVAETDSVADDHEDVLKLGVPGSAGNFALRDLAALYRDLVQRGRHLGVRFQPRVARFHHNGYAVSRYL